MKAESVATRILPVEGRDEGAVEGAEYAVGDLVAAVLEVAQEPDIPVPIGPIGDHAGEEFRHLGGVLSRVLEMIEKLLVMRQKPGQDHPSLLPSPFARPARGRRRCGRMLINCYPSGGEPGIAVSALS